MALKCDVILFIALSCLARGRDEPFDGTEGGGGMGGEDESEIMFEIHYDYKGPTKTAPLIQLEGMSDGLDHPRGTEHESNVVRSHQTSSGVRILYNKRREIRIRCERGRGFNIDENPIAVNEADENDDKGECHLNTDDPREITSVTRIDQKRSQRTRILNLVYVLLLLSNSSARHHIRNGGTAAPSTR